MNNAIILSVSGELDEKDKSALSSLSIDLIERNQLIGGGIITEAVILAISPFIIKGIKELLLALIDKKRNTSIKFGDIEINNIESSQIMKILTELNKMVPSSNDAVCSPNKSLKQDK